MRRITTSTKPCVRLVLIRDAQTEKHLVQQQGEFSKDIIETRLTEKGEEMTKALSCLESYVTGKRFCTPNPPEQKCHYVIEHVDFENPSIHYSTGIKATKMNSTVLLTSAEEILAMFTDNIQSLQKADKMSVYFVFTNTVNILRIVRDLLGLPDNVYIGMGLGSTTTIDVLENGEVFLHEFGNQACLEHGGFNTSSLFWWNNSA